MLRSGFIGGGANAATDEFLKSFQATAPTKLQEANEASNFLTTTKEEEKKATTASPPPLEQGDKQRVGLFTLLKYSTKTERYLMSIGIIMAAISGLCMPVWLLLLAQSLSTFNQIGQLFATIGEEAIDVLLDELFKLIYSFAIVGCITLISGTIYVSLWTYVGEAQTLRIRKKFVKSALNQDMGWFDTHCAGGDPQELSSLASNSILRIEMSLKRSIPDTLANLLASVGSLMVAFGLDFPLALYMLLTLPVIGICVGVLSCFMRKYSGKALMEFSSAGSFASEILTGIKTIASLRAEGWASERYAGHVEMAQRYSVLTIFCGKLASGLMGLLFYLIYTFAFAFGTTQAADNIDMRNQYISPFACMGITLSGRTRPIDCGITGSEVMVCIYGVILCAQFFALMNPGLNAINLGRIAALEVYGTIERTPPIDGNDNVKGEKLGKDFQENIEFENVVFAYPSRPNDIIFTNFNLSIEAGSAVALVGPSGSGKSSLSRLLLRLYDPVGGHIRVNGTPLSDINLKWWRQQIGYVSQEPCLFPGSIFDNIAAGKDGGVATDEEVKEAAKAASAHEFIMELPEAYDTFYSGSSIQLSGGQIQRISIARALVRSPKILLLDEATSALDFESERVVQDALDKIREQRKLTTVTVAHRLTTIVNSDKIVVLADGAIQESGTHSELYHLGGIYTTLAEGQGLTADATSGVKLDAIQEDADIVDVKEDVSKTELVEQPDVEKAEVREVSGKVEEVDDIDEVPNIDIAGVATRLKKYNRPEIAYTIVGYAGGIVAGCLPAAEAILFGLITGNFYKYDTGKDLLEVNLPICLWFILLAACSFIGNICLGVGFGVSGSRLQKRVRVLVFDKILSYSIPFFDFHSVGELTTMLDEDTDAVGNVTGLQQGQRVQVFTCLIAGMVVALAYAWQIGLIAIACVPLMLGASLLQSKYASRDPSVHSLISPETLLERSLANIVVLQAYGLRDDTSRKYDLALEPDANFKKKSAAYVGLAFGISQFAVFGTFALVFYAGVKLMLSAKLQFTDFFVALLSVMFSSFGAGQCGADFSSRKRGLESAACLFEVADGSMEDGNDPLSDVGNKPSCLDGNISFNNCHFAYPTRKNNMIYYSNGDRDGFSLDIDCRQSVAFTGRSGCGKSTALQILLRFYNVDKGTVKLDGQDISELNIGWLRDQIGYVGQMPTLFAGSIADNIKLGKPGATDVEIIAAAKAANAHDFILGLSKGYTTDIGVGGSLLSGGQRQRVAIARAIVKDPKILVCDEATAALDNESERVVQAALDNMQETNARTTLVVAHRLETVKKCDKIVVLDGGGVKEQGTHDELLKMEGIYHSLWTKQGH